MRFNLKLRERAGALSEFSYDLGSFIKYTVVNLRSFIQTQWRMSKLTRYGVVMGDHLRDYYSDYKHKEIKYVDLDSGESGIIEDVKVGDFQLNPIVCKSPYNDSLGPYKREQSIDTFGRTVVTINDRDGRFVRSMTYPIKSPKYVPNENELFVARIYQPSLFPDELVDNPFRDFDLPSENNAPVATGDANPEEIKPLS